LHSKAVDYVKTGQPAEMPKRLKPPRWPHFMEKRYKPKDATYHSEKILGQLYDKVESVDFIPQYQEPFDRRILRAYKLDDALLKSCRQIKSKYDTAMRRIMAQQEIKTEFEVWSTFVLSRPRVGTDYKVQEVMARYSDDLKNRFRMVCIEAAGSKDFAVLGPFVAGMYRVTKEELDIALAECRSTKLVGGREVPKRKMEPKYMPLISFPWLFEKELARIATGIEVGEDLDSQGLRPLVLRGDPNHPRKRGAGGDVDFEDFIQQDDGVIVHRGEILDLFRPDVDSEDLSGESDFEEARREHSIIADESSDIVPIASVKAELVPDHLLSGTGLEDIIPQVKLDGLTDPRKVAQHAHSLSTPNNKPHLEGSPSEDTSINGNATLPPEASVKTVDDHLKPDTPENISPEEEGVEEEVVELEVEKTALEKLAEMMAG
jgi:RNA-dependent RNA polymerase